MRLLEQVRQRQHARRPGAPSGGITSWIVRIVARKLSWASITPFGVPVVPEVKMRSQISSGRGRSQASTCASQSAGKVASGSADEGLDGRGREGGRARPRAGPARRGRCRGSGVAAPRGRRCRRSRRVLIRRSSGTRTSRARIAPKYAAGSSGVDGDQVRIRSPGSRPERPEPPRRDPAPPIELAVGPRSIVGRRRRGSPAPAGRRCVAESSRLERSVETGLVTVAAIGRVDARARRRTQSS